MSISKEKKSEVMKSFAVKSGDTGSVAVQCAVLTERINKLTGHLKGNNKDHQCRRGLLVMVNRRKKLLRYYKNKDVKSYDILVERLGMRKK